MKTSLINPTFTLNSHFFSKRILRGCHHHFVGMILMFVMLFGALLAPSHAAAADYLTVHIIEAQKNTHPKKKFVVDPKLKKIKSSLMKTFPKKTFKLLRSLKLKISSKKEHQLSITSRLFAQLLMLSANKKDVNLQLKVPKKKVKLNIKAKRGKLFFQAMRWKKKTYLLAFYVPIKK